MGKTQQLNCKNCKKKCCEGYLCVTVTNDGIILLPLSRRKMTIDGIPLERVTDRIWRCTHFDTKTGKCGIYKRRPLVCKEWYCEGHKIWDNEARVKKLKRTCNNSIYRLGFPMGYTGKR